MPWVKLDDAFYRNRKVRKVGLEATGLHARALSYAGENLDAHIDTAWVEEVGGKNAQKLAARLVEEGLWEQNGNGWVIHDFHEFNPTLEEYEAEAAKRSAAGKRAASARWSNARA